MTTPTSSAETRKTPAPIPPRFVTGSLFRHVVVMSTTGAIGLIAVFLVDLINLFYISLLGQQHLTAAIAFAGVVGFFQVSFCIGLMIGIAAVVARATGAGRHHDARRMATASLVLMGATCVVVSTVTYIFLEEILGLLGATGETSAQSLMYLRITVVSMPILGLGMACSSLLRAVGDAKRSMNVTLIGALMTAALDPILIFVFRLDLVGAAIAVVISRLVMLAVSMHGVHRAHRLLGRFDSACFGADARAVAQISGPAILANVATPFGVAFVTTFMAPFGAAAVAGMATIDRLTPVAFGLVYALSGAVGPIIAQNLGAGRIDRVRQTLKDSLSFMAMAVGGAWLILALSQRFIISAFSATGITAELISLFCSFLAASFVFVGALFVSNAAFNNLGRPLYSMGFNWARATLGTIPFAYIGSHYGPLGVLIGSSIGAVIFGSLATWVAFRITTELGNRQVESTS